MIGGDLCSRGIGLDTNRQTSVASSDVRENLSVLKSEHIFAHGKLDLVVSIDTSDNEILKKVYF